MITFNVLPPFYVYSVLNITFRHNNNN